MPLSKRQQLLLRGEGNASLKFNRPHDHGVAAALRALDNKGPAMRAALHRPLMPLAIPLHAAEWMRQRERRAFALLLFLEPTKTDIS